MYTATYLTKKCLYWLVLNLQPYLSSQLVLEAGDTAEKSASWVPPNVVPWQDRPIRLEPIGQADIIGEKWSLK